MIFATEIKGIPCQCEVALYAADFEYKILDMNVKPAPAIEAAIDHPTHLRLLEEYRFEDMAQYWRH